MKYAQSEEERKIVKSLVNEFLKNPTYRLRVACAGTGEHFTEKTRERSTIYRELTSVEWESLEVWGEGMDFIGWVSLIWGNGEDVISDHTLAPEIENVVRIVTERHSA